MSDSQGRRWQTRREVPRSIEKTKSFMPRGSSVERDKEGDSFVHLRWEETKEGDTVHGARLTIETGAGFPIGVTATLHFPEAAC